MNRLLKCMLAPLAIFSFSTPAFAQYSVSIGGFTGGGSVTGSFSGLDIDGDGILENYNSAGLNELTSLLLDYSGGGGTPTFEITLADDQGKSNPFYYKIGDTDFSMSGMTGFALQSKTQGFYIFAGRGVGFTCGGATCADVGSFFQDLVSSDVGSIGTISSAIPEAQTWGMLLLGMGAIGFAMRRRQVATRVSFVA